MKTAIVSFGLAALSLPAYAFTAAPVPPVNSQVIALECSIVGEQPLKPDPDPVYKIGVDMRTDVDGNPKTFDIVHTVRSGREYDRSAQYSGASIWKTSNRMEWFWKGYHGRTGMMIGELTWNTRDGWMYSETIYDTRANLPEFRMLADCHDRSSE